jgi:hypothetical protein
MVITKEFNIVIDIDEIIKDYGLDVVIDDDEDDEDLVLWCAVDDYVARKKQEKEIYDLIDAFDIDDVVWEIYEKLHPTPSKS